ncbi:MAG: amidohydrolase [Candidatus Adiutrix sp.]|jgi:predicted amidohydrolase YtcJ|nr:amidohydrolase [Candidatus Adiutrix sp.]
MSEPELLAFDGRIYTLEPGRPLATVLAARGQNLIYVGSDLEAARKLLSPEARTLDLGGRPVLPGLIDGHAHLFSEGIKLAELDVFQKSRAETLEIIRREAAARSAGQWIVGHGWNQEIWPGRAWPTRAELDTVAPHNPVVIDRVDKHSIWVNSPALGLAGLTDQTPDPPGGEYLRDDGGRLQGILIGQGMWAVKNLLPPLDDAGLYEALLRGQAEMISFGLTSLMEAGATLRHLALLRRGYQSRDLKIRIRAMLLGLEKQDEAYLAAGHRPVRHLFEERLSIDGLKIHADGSLGSRSAWLKQDYADRPGHRGEHFFSDEQLLTMMSRARANGLTVSVHAIGDAAAAQALNAMEKVFKAQPGEDLRWRLEHFQVVGEGDLERALALGVVPSIQSVGLMSDLAMAEDRLGPEVIRRSYLWRAVLDQGGLLVNGSDGPVESVNPFEGLYAAVTRRNLAGQPAGGWRPEHCLSRLEALKSYTSWAAWSEFNEYRKGTLKAGKLADFIVLDGDPLVCPEEEIKDIRVLKTIIGGELVFERPA